MYDHLSGLTQFSNPGLRNIYKTIWKCNSNRPLAFTAYRFKTAACTRLKRRTACSADDSFTTLLVCCCALCFKVSVLPWRARNGAIRNSPAKWNASCSKNYRAYPFEIQLSRCKIGRVNYQFSGGMYFRTVVLYKLKQRRQRAWWKLVANE